MSGGELVFILVLLCVSGVGGAYAYFEYFGIPRKDDGELAAYRAREEESARARRRAEDAAAAAEAALRAASLKKNYDEALAALHDAPESPSCHMRALDCGRAYYEAVGHDATARELSIRADIDARLGRRVG